MCGRVATYLCEKPLGYTMRSPTVSVVLPVYNAAPFLDQTLKSIRGQTLKDIEIICIDDGSTDGSTEIIGSHTPDDNRIKLFGQTNQGAGAARNRGLLAASGQFLWFADADDTCESNLLELAVSNAELHEADVVVFESDEFDSSTATYRPLLYAMDARYLPNGQMVYRPMARPDVIFQPFNGWAWDKLFRRTLLLDNKLQFQELRTTNDLFLVLAAIAKSEKLSLVRQVLVHHRSGTPDSLSATRELSWRCCFEALAYLQEWLQTNMLYHQVVKSFVNFAADLIAWNLSTLKQPQLAEFAAELERKYVWKLDLAGCPRASYHEKWHYDVIGRYWRKPTALSPILLYRQLAAMLKWKLVLNKHRH
jgi:glycosyltransferase involved in cell wall biosynthesis